MKSRTGFWASVIFLSAIPAALIVQTLTGRGAETVLHFSFAIASGLLALATLDIRMPLPLRVAGATAATSLACIFGLQALDNLIQNRSLSYIAFDILGQQPERLLIDTLLLWLAAAVLFDSRAHTRVLGFITVGAAIAVELYNYWLNCHGTNLDAEFAILKIVLLVPFVWLLVKNW
jgi:hypothetical protein